MKHILATVDNANNHMPYDVDIFQSAYDYITVDITNGLWHEGRHFQYDFPVKKRTGFIIKVNTASISTDTGKAEDLINFLDTDIGKSFIRGMVHKLIFDRPKKSKTQGL